MEEKGAKVTCRVSLPGRYLVYLPNSRGVFVSSKIEDEKKREFFLNLFRGALNNEGVIVRTSAVRATKEELAEDLEKLRERWREILDTASRVKTGLVYEEVPLFMQTVRDRWQDIKEIVVDDRDIWTELLGFLEKRFPQLMERVRYVKNMSVFFKRYNLDRVLSKIFARYVWLKGGGYIVIEETEAMTVIDVNSGAGCGETLEENALRTNLEAAGGDSQTDKAERHRGHSDNRLHRYEGQEGKGVSLSGR
ncbi:MAG: ribonuclease E/G [Aquificota bacterium]|nr:ribonuclease E/G [Aquificota bacterium]